MWLEETAWLWIPLICVIAGGVIWRIVALGREVKALERRIGRFEQSEDPAPAKRRKSDRAVA